MMGHSRTSVVQQEAFMGDKSSLGWQTKRFNLTDYRGEDIRLKFTFVVIVLSMNLKGGM